MARIVAIESIQAWVSNALHLEIYKREAADLGRLGEGEARPCPGRKSSGRPSRKAA